MSNLDFPSLALVGTPLQWGGVVLLAVLLFAPRLLPPLARLLGRLFALRLTGEIERRTGLSARPPRPPSRPVPPQEATARSSATLSAPPVPKVEVLPPKLPAPPSRRAEVPTDRADTKSLWWTAAVVCALLALVSWYLFHAR
jgi:hypothetical protein